MASLKKRPEAHSFFFQQLTLGGTCVKHFYFFGSEVQCSASAIPNSGNVALATLLKVRISFGFIKIFLKF